MGEELAKGVGEQFVAAFSAADFGSMRALLSEDLVAFVTNSDGGTDRVEGRDDYLDRIEAMDLPSAGFTVELTQPPVVEAKPAEIDEFWS